MSWSVCVLTPNGRRHTVRCAADTTLLQVLEQTCKKFEFPPEEYDLTHHNRVVDLTATLRFSGLPNNASLEMSPAKKVRVESEVVLGLQLENGNRLMGTFQPSISIFDVLSTLVPDQCDVALNPVVIYMRKEIYGLENLNETTLKSLGLTSGRAILRLVHRTPEQLKTQAYISTHLPKKEKIEEIPRLPKVMSSITDITDNSIPPVEEAMNIVNDEEVNMESNEPKFDSKEINSDNNLIDLKQDPIDNNLIDFNEEPIDTNEECTSESDIYNEEIIDLGERSALVFSQNTANQLPLDDLPDDFYNLTVPEVKKLFFDLCKNRQNLENRPLKTEAIRNLETDEKISKQMRKNEKVVIRILFPDRIVLQGTFVPIDKISIVKDFVKTYLQNENEPFDLYVTPPKQILSPEISLYDARCVPSAIIHFGPIDKGTDVTIVRQYLKEEILSKLSTPEAALKSASMSRGLKKIEKLQNTSNTAPSTNIEPSQQTKSSNTQSYNNPGPSAPKNSNVPKWFKMNTK